jgi:hypothetical protein
MGLKAIAEIYRVLSAKGYGIITGRTHLKMVQSQERYRWMDKRK